MQGKQEDCFTPAGSAFAFVSPCSTCQNQLSAPGDGKPYCPRRKWQADQAAYELNNQGNPDPRMIPLALYGTEGTPREGNQSLQNPVYTNDSSLVWIATLRDNSGLRDTKDNVITPSILDPTFFENHTEYIQCRLLPYIPAQHEAAYRTGGALKEKDTVLAITTQNQQNYSSTVVDGADPNSYQQVLIEGVVSKVNLVFNTPRASIDVDFTINGA